jgi:16S rRNA (adenine1518-N6/adenine1519-N6)-dimethyltransferase
VRRSERDPLFQKKSLGQVFLTTDWPVTRMVERLRDLKVQRVIEIGPGAGVLTRALVAAGIRVTAIEKDDRFAARLVDWAKEAKEQAAKAAEGRGTCEVVNADILQFDWEGWLASGTGRAAVVGNIPYNISTPILIRALSLVDKLVGVLMMTQLEFALRVAARPDNKDYGSLTVFAQLRSDVTMEFKVDRTCFNPVPKVDSAVILAVPKRSAERLDDKTLARTEQVTRAAFTQRRKKMRNSIRQLLDARGGEAGCPIDLDRRAETLSPQEFVELGRFLFDD